MEQAAGLHLRRLLDLLEAGGRRLVRLLRHLGDVVDLLLLLVDDRREISEDLVHLFDVGLVVGGWWLGLGLSLSSSARNGIVGSWSSPRHDDHRDVRTRGHEREVQERRGGSVQNSTGDNTPRGDEMTTDDEGRRGKPRDRSDRSARCERRCERCARVWGGRRGHGAACGFCSGRGGARRLGDARRLDVAAAAGGRSRRVAALISPSPPHSSVPTLRPPRPRTAHGHHTTTAATDLVDVLVNLSDLFLALPQDRLLDRLRSESRRRGGWERRRVVSHQERNVRITRQVTAARARRRASPPRSRDHLFTCSLLIVHLQLT